MRFEDIRKRVQGCTARVVLAAADDHTALEALHQAVLEGIAEPLLIGDTAAVTPILASIGIPDWAPAIIHEPTVEAAAALAFRMVGDGRADLVMKGHLPTPVLLKAAIHPDNGFTRGRLLSHVGFFQPPILNRILCLTDTGMVLYPDLEKKAAILENAIQFMQKMGVERPVAAILTASEKPTPKMPCSMDAVELVKMAEQGRFNNAVIWGPVDVSIALDPKAAEIKGVPGTWSGKTDIWLLPEMVGGNIVGKVFMFIAKAEAGGVIVGGKSPIIMLSRASTPEEKYHSILMGVAASQEG